MLKAIADLLNQYGNLLLAVITGIYAFFTYRMARLMAQQMLAKIVVAKIVVGSPFLEQWFQKALEEKRVANKQHKFRIVIHLTNKGAGNGSIDKPSLILQFNDGRRLTTPPVIKKYIYVPGQELAPLGMRGEDLGSTIFLAGGDRRRAELTYQVKINEDIASLISSHPAEIKYYAAYNDNLDRSHLLQIKDIMPIENTENIF